MMDIFLSASVPLPERDRRFFESVDVLAVREAIKALVDVVLPIGRITFGGHPAITPLIAFFIREAGLDRDRLTIFQSRFFDRLLPEENKQFHDVRMIDAVPEDREGSLRAMRIAMIKSRAFQAAVIIGGMEGVLEEATLFGELCPNARILPVASTGAAAREVFRRAAYPRELESELTYATLFRRHLPPE